MKVEKFKIAGWKYPEIGLLIDENEEWVLVKHIPVDYVIDGYKLLRKEYILKRTSTKKEKSVELVLSLKGIKEDKPEGFKFKDVVQTLQWSQEKYGLFEFQDETESELFYGRINEVSEGLLIIDMIKSNGKEEKAYDFTFELNQIRVITCETNYFHSIQVLWRHQKEAKKKKALVKDENQAN